MTRSTATSRPLVRACLLAGLGLAVLGAPPARADGAGQFISNEGVPPEVEKMYRNGLRFLAAAQAADGSFAGGGYDDNPGVVGLAGLAFLAHGDNPASGPYAGNIRRVVDFILKQQRSDGYIGNSMYNHGFATLFLAEVYGMVPDERIGPALQKAVDLIADSQARNPFGAWRYSPDSTDADTTVSGACFVALAAAANAGIKIPDTSYAKALKFFRLCQGAGGDIGYTSANGGSETLTSIGALCFTLARDKKAIGYRRAVAFLETTPGGVANGRNYPDYTRYYKSQACFHAGPELWEAFNAANIADLKQSQLENGGWTGPIGTVFSTSASLLSLALNYRFLPIYER